MTGTATSEGRKVKNDVVGKIPGGWFGNNPEAAGWGDVVVDASRIAQAVLWLRRRRFWIVSTEGKADFPNGAAVGVLIQYRRQ
jgi:hypothetical protein